MGKIGDYKTVSVSLLAFNADAVASGTRWIQDFGTIDSDIDLVVLDFIDSF